MVRKPAGDDQEALQLGSREALSALEVTLALGSAFAALVKASHQQSPGLGWHCPGPSASVSALPSSRLPFLSASEALVSHPPRFKSYRKEALFSLSKH